MNVSEITARFMRRVQIKDYEPAEAEISLKAHLDDGEDFVTAGTELILQSREIALTGLRGKTAGETETSVTTGAKAPTAAEQKKSDAAERRKAKKLEKETAEAAKTPDSDVPGGEEAAKPAAAEASSDVPGDDDIPGEPATAESVADDDSAGAMTVEDLQSYITGQVTSKKIGVKEVKTILAGVGASRTSEVKPEDIEAVKASVELESKA